MKYLLFSGLILMACTKTQPHDPYVRAKVDITQAVVVVTLADGVFGQLQKSPETQRQYLRHRTAVASGLQLAVRGVDSAEQAGVRPEMDVLLHEANTAYKQLRSFLKTAAKGDKALALVNEPLSKPASLRSTLRLTISPVHQLPHSLMPAKKGDH